MSNRGGSNDIWVMNADGSQAQRLTTSPAADDFCSIK
jgi:Tol biopolymer transport system component